MSPAIAASLALALVAFALAVAVGPRWLRFLRVRQLGKQLNPSEPEEHAAKEGTPTMGGVVFLFPIIAVVLAFQVVFAGSRLSLVPLALVTGCAVLGLVDDSQTLVGKERSAGLSPRTKWAVVIVLCLAVAGALDWAGYATVRVPVAGAVTLPGWLYVPLAAVVLVSTVFSVGITDGMDSLLGTTAGIAFVAFWIVGLWQGQGEAAALCAAAVGALLGYLWFNAFPAQMFMGDVGSLPLGGLLGTVALLERQPLLLLPVGIIFVANALSDVLQVLSVRLRGTRLFRIAPLHHHFRRAGWPETWVVQRFWIVGAAGALIGLLVVALEGPG